MSSKTKLVITIIIGWFCFVTLMVITSNYWLYYKALPKISNLLAQMDLLILGIAIFFLIFLVTSVFRIFTNPKDLENKAMKRTIFLENRNKKLQRQLSEYKLVERELIIHKEHLVKLAHYDELTGLPNKVFLNEILNKAISQGMRHNKIIGLLFVNLDHFRKINTSFGRPIGDFILKEHSKRIINVLRAGDIIARSAGDEFIVLLNDIDQPASASHVAEKILQAISQPLKIQDTTCTITASIGIAIFPHDGTSLETLQKNVDKAMFKVKHMGGNSFQYYHQEMHNAVHEQVKLESALRNALVNHELVLYFQPQLSLEDGTIKSVEALIRWQHPELGLIGPDKFISFAEETDLIIPIGVWALEEACKINRRWQDEGYDSVVIAVNISPKQLLNSKVTQTISKALQQSNLDPHYLELEITETAVMNNIDTITERLNEIHQMGVRIAIDDFGTGYTSITSLKHFPIDSLKIDQTYVKGIPNKQNDVAITTTVISLAHNLGLQVIAEGVETTEQMRFLAEQGCDLIQGYFLSRPLSENKIRYQLSKRGKVKEKVVTR